MSKKTPHETRQKLIHAAIALLVAQPTQFTLDQVAADARVSKGGLLHHFPSKEALLHALVEVSELSWTTRLAQELALEPEGVPGRWCRAYIRSTFDQRDDERLLNAALAKARNIYPGLLTDLEGKSWHSESDDGLPPGRARIVQLACDGYWFALVTNALAMSDTDLNHIKSELERYTHDT